MKNTMKVVDALLKDLTNRRGFRQIWDQTDPDIREELKTAWATILNDQWLDEVIELDRRVTALENKDAVEYSNDGGPF